MKTNGSVQYTLREVPPSVDEALRLKARREGKSLNAAALDTLSAGLCLSGEPVRYKDLDFMVGSWEEDPSFEAAIQAQDQIDPGLWR
jgi:plasmid stability protein